MKIVCVEITLIYLVVHSASFPVEYGDEDDDSGHLGHTYNTGSPLYYGHSGQDHHEYDDYPGYDGYASYAPHHDYEHYAYPRYKFEYGVHDPHTGDIKKQYEERDGDTVRGFYSLVEPDGSIRIVEYTADDKHGFQATVKKIGPSHHPVPVPTHHTPDDHHHHHHNTHHGHHHHTYDDQPYPYYPPHNDISHYFPAHYPQAYPHKDEEEEDGYGYNVYESNEHTNPNLYGYGNDNAYYHYGLGGQEYDESAEDYPYNANINYPAYILPQNTYSSIQDLTAYGAPQDDIENQDKFYNKRSPLKKEDNKDLSQDAQKSNSTKPDSEVKNLENDASNAENKNVEIKAPVSVTESSKNIKSQETKTH